MQFCYKGDCLYLSQYFRLWGHNGCTIHINDRSSRGVLTEKKGYAICGKV